MPRLLSKEVGHTCTPKSRSSFAHTGKRAFELAQDYSITNSRLALGGTLVLGGVLALSQVQSAEAADWNFTDEAGFALAAANANSVSLNSDPEIPLTRIIFGGTEPAVINTAVGVSFTREVIIGNIFSQRFTLAPTDNFSGPCLICSTSNITLNNVVLDLTNKAAVSALSVNASADVVVALNDVEVKNVSGATAIEVSGAAATTVTINNSNIYDNAGAAGASGVAGGSVIVISSNTNATVTLSGDTTILNNDGGAGGAGAAGGASAPDAAGGDGGSIIEVTAGTKATVIISDTVEISGNDSGAGGAGGSSGTGASRISGGAGGAGGSIILLDSSNSDAELIISETVEISGNSSGAGGAGAPGIVVVTTYF